MSDKLLLTVAEMVRDGVAIAIEAETRERRVKALEMTRRVIFNLARDLDKELERLKD